MEDVSYLSGRHKIQQAFRSMNPNVRIILISDFFQAVGRGIWIGSVLSAFIYLLAGESNELLGLTSAATGTAMTLTVFPAGWASDRWKRENVVRTAVLIGILSLVAMVFVESFTQLVIVLILWGIFQGMARPSVDALFADSIPSGERSLVYAIRHFIRNIANAIGPFFSILVFLWLGDVWELEILMAVMMVGIGFSALGIILLLFLTDKNSLGQQSESLDLDEMATAIVQQENGAILRSSSRIDENKVKRWTRLVPYILVGSNVIIGLGAGMTVRFFPIFFWKIYTLSPIDVQLLNGIGMATTGIMGLLAQKLSKRMGRVETIIGVQIIAIFCLYGIAFYPPVMIVAILFVARISLMNASQPLSRSILMDFVPKRSRGRWNSIEAIAWGLFWNASAAIGGYLIGPENNFRRNFLVTATLYLIATLILLPLAPFVAREKESPSPSTGATS